MTQQRPSLTFFVVFEPCYALGCLATLSSLARRASLPVVVDIVMRSTYRQAAKVLIDKLGRVHGERIQIREVIVSAQVIADCDAIEFRAHFIAETLFRLYYFDLTEAHGEYVAYLDIDMILLGDPFALRDELTVDAPLHVVEAKMPGPSAKVTPAHMTRYMNAGFLVFDTRDPPVLRNLLRRTQQIVKEIAANSVYIDQDALNIGFYDDRQFLPRKWNFTLQQFTTFPLPDDVVILHATGSQKPWFYRGRHPFNPWYEEEADFLGLNRFERYDFVWAFRRIARKIAIHFGR